MCYAFGKKQDSLRLLFWTFSANSTTSYGVKDSINMGEFAKGVSSTPPECEDSKIWIGNLDSTVTEYQLLQILKRFGKIQKFEFLFHMHGQLKGKPKGYCFVKFETKAESENAMKELNGIKIESKKIIVDWARKQQTVDQQSTSTKREEKQDKMGKEISNERKIKAIESKLRLMEQGIETTISNPLKEKLNSGKQVARTGTHPYRHHRRKPHRR